eukprot:1158019-Pelagomonas_calceolata.AAC.3
MGSASSQQLQYLTTAASISPQQLVPYHSSLCHITLGSAPTQWAVPHHSSFRISPQQLQYLTTAASASPQQQVRFRRAIEKGSLSVAFSAGAGLAGSTFAGVLTSLTSWINKSEELLLLLPMPSGQARKGGGHGHKITDNLVAQSAIGAAAAAAMLLPSCSASVQERWSTFTRARGSSHLRALHSAARLSESEEQLLLLLLLILPALPMQERCSNSTRACAHLRAQRIRGAAAAAAAAGQAAERVTSIQAGALALAAAAAFDGGLQTPLDKNAPAIKVQLKNCRLCYAPQAALRQEGASKQRLLRQRRTEARSCIKAMLAQAKPHEGKKLHQSNACSGEAALHCTKAKLWH